MEGLVSAVSGLLWGWLLWIVILLAGAWLTYKVGGRSITKIPYAFKQLWLGRAKQGEGAIAPFGALMVSLSATIGTGNIAGVATAIGLGGPGALFWMWCSALLGMATKYAEAVCAVQYREVDGKGNFVGGPMYYIKNGMGEKWRWLAGCFAVFGALAGFGIGNAVQANSVADALKGAFPVLNDFVISIALFVLVGAVLIGGIQRIADVAKTLVPVMSVSYLVLGFVVLLANITAIPEAIVLVVDSAFTGVAAKGGAAGITVMMAVQFGIARGVFSNEAGLGSAPIAHAAAATDHPVRQGTVAMLGTFIDTLIICSVTGLAIVVSGAWDSDVQGVAMSQQAFASVIPFGDVFVSIALSVFAFTTIIGWSYYGERCAQYLFGEKIEKIYRLLWVLMIPVGVFMSLNVVWGVADILNGLMALPNLVALIALSGVVAKLTREYYGK